MTEDSISGALERMERRAEIAMKHTKEDMDYEKAEGWKRAVEHYTCAAEALKEIRKYRAIGTVEECREAVERQRAKKPIEYEDKYYACPQCDNVLMFKWEKYPSMLKDKKNGLPYCLSCGQAIDWRDNP